MQRIKRLPIDHTKDSLEEALGFEILDEITSKHKKLPIEAKLRIGSIAVYQSLPAELRGVLALGTGNILRSRLVEAIEDFLEEAVRRYGETFLNLLVGYLSKRVEEEEDA